MNRSFRFLITGLFVAVVGCGGGAPTVSEKDDPTNPTNIANSKPANTTPAPKPAPSRPTPAGGGSAPVNGDSSG